MTTPNNSSSSRPLDRRDVEDVVMEDAPPRKPTMPHKYKTPQLAETYTIIERNRAKSHTPSGFGGINERGEPIMPRPTSERPVIHESTSIKRQRDDAESGNSAKRVSK
jgi:hypothetical protein